MKTQIKLWIGLAGAAGIGLTLATSCVTKKSAAADPSLSVADEIRIEACRPSVSDVGHALPLASSWNDGDGFSPAWQLEMIQKGHYLLPWISYGAESTMPKWTPVQYTNYLKSVSAHCQAPLEGMAKLHLPLCFLTTEWDAWLTWFKEYNSLPADKNPNVVTADGKVDPNTLSPFGPIELWREVGKRWTDEGFIRQFQAWYPDPPLVIFNSNNEHQRLPWTRAEDERRYLEKYGKGRSDEFKRDATAKAWEERFRALQKGFMEEFASSDWKRHSIYIGYNAWGYPGRPPVAGWDGGSPEYYVGNWTSMTDFQVNSPQIHWMNVVCMVNLMNKVNPKFWFEHSVWDGNEPGRGDDKMRLYAKLGQDYTPERYEGYVQFGMWLTRARCVRDFRGSGDTFERVGAYLMACINAVDRVHTNPTLRSFWRTGELVPNRAQEPLTPTDTNSPCANADRWFLLDTSLDPQRPWDNNTALPVMSLALVQGKAPKREWLVLAYAPLGARTGVTVTVPGFGPITVDASQAGSFYLVSEQTKKTTTVVAGKPASVRVVATADGVEPGKPVAFVATDAYNPDGKLASFRWDFGDGKQGDGMKVDHAYATKGTYVAKLTATDGKGAEVSRILPVHVGQETDSGLVLRYPMVKADNRVVYDVSGRGNNGLRTGAEYVNDSERGSVLELNGKRDCVPVYNTPDINIGGPYANRTVSLWFKANDVKNREFLYEEGGSGNGLCLYLFKGKLYGGVWVSSVWPGTWLAADNIEPNQWVHVTLVLRDAPATAAPDKLELYVNGKKVASGQAAALQMHVADINVGRCGNSRCQDMAVDGEGLYFAGRIGDVRIYDRALSESEIAEMAK